MPFLEELSGSEGGFILDFVYRALAASKPPCIWFSHLQEPSHDAAKLTKACLSSNYEGLFPANTTSSSALLWQMPAIISTRSLTLTP